MTRRAVVYKQRMRDHLNEAASSKRVSGLFCLIMEIRKVGNFEFTVL